MPVLHEDCGARTRPPDGGAACPILGTSTANFRQVAAGAAGPHRDSIRRHISAGERSSMRSTRSSEDAWWRGADASLPRSRRHRITNDHERMNLLVVRADIWHQAAW